MAFLPIAVQGKLKPRPYQQEALDALDLHLATKTNNPCVVIPTGGGKSIIIAWAIQGWKEGYPKLRVCILAHRKELVAQNSEELRDCWPASDIGIYSAGLNSRDTKESILYASIDSIFRKGGELEPFDVIIVDEAHRIPPTGEGKYRKFIKMCTLANPDIRIIGFTATAYRMGGPLCHSDHILNEICYEANIGTLIRDGFLCDLRSQRGKEQPDLEGVKRNGRGDYILTELSRVMDQDEIIQKAICSSVKILREHKRKSVLFFCVDVEHCYKVSKALAKLGLEAPFVTGTTSSLERDRLANRFKAGRLKALCNVNVYTEGFNAKRVDCIVLLRPTLSKGLYVQMVGRGFRLHPEKDYCLILDYAHCIDEHGPIDCIEPGAVKLIDCEACSDTFSRQVRKCPNCGWDIPPIVIERDEAEEREKRMHEIKASERSILSSEPETLTIDDVEVHLHKKEGKPDSIRVSYRCGLLTVREWICLDHEGLSGQKAKSWWSRRKLPAASSTAEALENMFLSHMIKDVTETITFVQRGKFKQITGFGLNFEVLAKMGG